MNIFFNENLKELRLEKGLTQERLADFFGVAFQTVSKWERGESYPDIAMLPDIAGFFGVSVDDLLGVSRAENEEEIVSDVEKYYNYVNDMDKKHSLAEEMIKKHPNDYRVQFVYMGDLICRTNEENLKENFPKIRSIYDNIQDNCFNDEVRIGSKNLMASFYCRISEYDNSFVTFDDAKSIVEQLPKMRDCKEAVQKCLYIHDEEKRHIYSAKLLDTEISELCGDLWQHVFFDCFGNNGEYKTGKYPKEYIIEILEIIVDLIDKLYDDGNYGSMWRTISYDYGHLGHLYFEIGNEQKALEKLKKAAELSKAFDNSDRITTMHSRLFEGITFDKDTLGSTYIACSRMKELMTEKYPLSDEFKNTDEFREILNILDC